jgi:hypothetical protein
MIAIAFDFFRPNSNLIQGILLLIYSYLIRLSDSSMANSSTLIWDISLYNMMHPLFLLQNSLNYFKLLVKWDL